MSPLSAILTVPCSALKVEESIVPSISETLAITCAISSVGVVSTTVITGTSFISVTVIELVAVVLAPLSSVVVTVIVSKPL